MSSTKSRLNKQSIALAPQRRNGKLRVTAILKAATQVIAERGYEAATMAEIAARSDTTIGSLYRFFPSKESLTQAMIARYCENIDRVFDAIDGTVPSLSFAALTDALLAAILELRKDGGATIRLMESYKGWSDKREELRNAALKRIARTLMLYRPGLKAATARSMALVILYNMKIMKAFSALPDKKIQTGAIKELRHMTQLYLESRLCKV